MGTLELPQDGTIYIDAQIVIYTIDKHPIYAPLCRPLWDAAKSGKITVVSSELILMETLVSPLREGNRQLASDREALWQQENTGLIPITMSILRSAAQLRATTSSVKTPDAIHAATALYYHCSLFLTNDAGFRRISNLTTTFLDDLR